MSIDAEAGLAAQVRELRAFADDEGLIVWTKPNIAACLNLADPSSFMTETVGSRAVLAYRAGRPRSSFAYLVGTEREGSTSLLPPPSIQDGANRVAYHHRDDWICHLCGAVCVTTWNRRREWPSLDHLIPRFHGGRDYPSNLKTAHVSCNKARRERAVDAFVGSPLTRQVAFEARVGVPA